MAIVVLIGAALALRKRRPLASLGVLWFFGAHALTSTIIPLELVYEHRNYFASLGLCLVLADVLFVMPKTADAKRMLTTWINRFAASLLYPTADGVIAISRGVERNVRKYVRKAPLVAIANPLPIDRAVLRQVAPLRFPRPTVLACGRLAPQKDYPTMLRAFSLVGADLDAQLVILGDGPLRPALESMREVARKMAEAGQHSSARFASMHPEAYGALGYGRLDARRHGVLGVVARGASALLPLVAGIVDGLIALPLPYALKAWAVRLTTALAYWCGTARAEAAAPSPNR